MFSLSHRFLRRALNMCAVLTVVASTVACGPTCDPGKSVCNGSVLESCPYGSDNGPMQEYCLACKDLSNGATCVDSTSPVSECASVANGTEVCWNGSPTTCQDGYPTPYTTTGACASGTVCVAAGGSVFCALSADPDPACAGTSAPAVAVCSGQDQVECEQGYALSRTACASGTTCASVGGAPMCM